MFDLASKVTVACSRRHLWIQSLQVLGGQSHCGGISSAISACEMNGASFPWKKKLDGFRFARGLLTVEIC